MLEHLVRFVSHLGHWGYVIIFLGVTLECSAFLGVVVPGETLVVIGGFLASQGILDWGDLVILVWIGAAVGDSIGYELGRHRGREWLLRYGHWVRIRERHLNRAEQFFERHGGKAVLLGRFVAIIRTLAPFVAGTSKMPYRRFLVWNVTGGILWSVAYVTLGYVAGESWHMFEKWIGRASLILAGIFVLAIGAAWLGRVLVRHEADIRAWWSRVLNRPLVYRFRKRYAAEISFLADRLRPGGVFGLHLTIGIIILALAAWAFGEIADAIAQREGLVQVDKHVAVWLHAHTTSGIATAAKIVTWAGSLPVVATLGGLLAVYFVVSRKWYRLLELALLLPGGAIMNVIMKSAFERSRPDFAHPIVVLTSSSFPSGHAEAAVLIYSFLALLAIRRWPSWRASVGAILIAAVLIVLIGFSRMVLGVHYLSDVLGGYAEAAAWFAICLTATETLRRSRLHRSQKKLDLHYPQEHCAPIE